MKTKTDKRKLMLNRETVLQLQPEMLDKVVGGAWILSDGCYSILSYCPVEKPK